MKPGIKYICVLSVLGLSPDDLGVTLKHICCYTADKARNDTFIYCAMEISAAPWRNEIVIRPEVISASARVPVKIFELFFFFQPFNLY